MRILGRDVRQASVSMCAHRKSGDTVELKNEKKKKNEGNSEIPPTFIQRRKNFKQKFSVGQNWGLTTELVYYKACLTA